jgi:hypothetical protein
MSKPPDTLTLEHHRDRRGRIGPWWRWVGTIVVLAVPVLALFNIFGQRTDVKSVSTPGAKLTLFAPSNGRGGLMYTAKFNIVARQELKNATLILAPGWADQYTSNGITPQPSNETSSNGKLVWSLGDISQGKTYTEFVSLQINPINVGDHTQTVWLYDGSRQVAVLNHHIRIWP